MIALLKRPREPGATRCAHTDQPPADSPPIVMALGSPPKAAMLRLIQPSAACWSSKPKSPPPVKDGSARKQSAPSPPEDRAGRREAALLSDIRRFRLAASKRNVVVLLPRVL